MIKNILANFIGRFWGIFSNFLFIPLYIYFLGIRGYSIISFSLVLAGIMGILDAGLTATLSKEFASKSNDIETKKKVFITLESCYLIITIVIIFLFLLFSNTIAIKWLNIESVSSAIISNYLRIIGIGLAFQLLTNFYIGGFYGLELQIKANVYQVIFGIIRNGLVVLPLLYTPSLYWFFCWQTSSTIIYTLLLRHSLKNTIFKNEIISFFRIDKSILKKVWKFAGGILLIALVAAVNTQMDKLAISKLLPIEKLGYYTLAISLSQGLIILITPIATAVLPRFTSLFSENKIKEVTDLYQRIFLVSSIIVFSFAANMILNAESLIWIWTGNKQFAIEAGQFVPYLATGMLMLSLQYIPYNVALANGYTRLNNYLGIISLIVTLPGYWIMTKQFGPIGAAIVWGFVQSIITPIYLYYINKKFLQKIVFSKILTMNILLPGMLAFIIAYACFSVKYFQEQRWGMFFWIGFSTILTLFVLIFSFIGKFELSKAYNYIIKK